MPHGKIDILSCEVDVMQGCGNPQIDVGVRFGKPAQAIHQPLGGKIGRRADRQSPAPGLMLDALRAESNTIKSVAHHLQVGAAGPRDGQPLPFAVEQPDAQFELERLHLMAYRALRHRQLFGRSGEALVASRRLEGLQGIERWQSAGQIRTSVMRKTRPGTRNHALRRPAGWSISAPHVNMDAVEG